MAGNQAITITLHIGQYTEWILITNYGI